MTALGLAGAGPFVNEAGDWWVPVEGIGFREARAIVLACFDDGVLRLAYLGKAIARLDDDHEAGCGDDCPSIRARLAYHFEERGRW